MMGENACHQKRSNSSSLKCPQSILNTLYICTTIKEMKNDDDDQTVSLKLTTSFVSQKTFALLFPRIVMRYHEILKNEFHCLCYPRSTI